MSRHSHRLQSRTVLLVLAVGATAVSVPLIEQARRRANCRACYANQKTIAGAMEMYSYVGDGTGSTITIDENWAAPLLSNGYLSVLPDDPGFPEQRNYILIRGQDIACLKHGSIQGNDGVTVLDELKRWGLSDQRLLARASTVHAFAVEPATTSPHPLVLIIAAMVLLAFVSWLIALGHYFKGPAPKPPQSAA